ncbi:MAG: hypothetical protein AAGU27_19755 [Dehalobacterium sp.]
MKTIDNIDFKINTEELILMIGAELSSERVNQMIEDNADFINQSYHLIQPKAIFDVFNVEKVLGDRLYLNSHEYFESKLFSYFMSDAKYITLSIMTIGNRIEEESDKYMKSGKYVKGFILDGIGTLALEKLGLELYECIKEEARERGLNFSSPLSPGQVGWDVKDQEKVFSRLNAGMIGIKLTESSLMIPKKSVSLAVGIGENMRADKKACNFCPLRKTCPSRKVKDYQETNDVV